MGKRRKKHTLRAATLRPLRPSVEYTDEEKRAYYERIQAELFKKRGLAQRALYSDYLVSRQKFDARAGVIRFLDGVTASPECTGRFSFALAAVRNFSRKVDGYFQRFADFFISSGLISGVKLPGGSVEYLTAWLYLLSPEFDVVGPDCLELPLYLPEHAKVTPRVINGFEGFDFDDFTDLLATLHDSDQRPAVPAVCRCGAPLPAEGGIDGFSRVSVDVETGRGYYDRINCHSTWTCPVCAQRDGYARACQISEGIKNFVTSSDNARVLFVTFTLPHDVTESAGEVLSNLKNAYRDFVNQRSIKRFRRDNGYVGFIKSTDWTINPRVVDGRELPNWHAHYHTLWFFETPRGAHDLADDALNTFVEVWDACQGKETGRDLNREHGLDVEVVDLGMRDDPNFDEIAEYVGKTVSLYVGKTSNDDAGKLTPFDLLVDADDPKHYLYKRWFVDYYRGSKGVRRMMWSPRLKDRLGVTEQMERQKSSRYTVDVATVSPAAVRAMRRVYHDGFDSVFSQHSVIEWAEKFLSAYASDVDGVDVWDGDRPIDASDVSMSQDERQRDIWLMLQNTTYGKVQRKYTPADLRSYAKGRDMLAWLASCREDFADAACMPPDGLDEAAFISEYQVVFRRMCDGLGIGYDLKGFDTVDAINRAAFLNFLDEKRDLETRYGAKVQDLGFDPWLPFNGRSPELFACRDIVRLCDRFAEGIAGNVRSYVSGFDVGEVSRYERVRFDECMRRSFTGAFRLADFYDPAAFSRLLDPPPPRCVLGYLCDDVCVSLSGCW